MSRYDNIIFREYSNLLCQIKFGERLIGKPELKVTTFYPPGWNPNSTKSFAEASEAWRRPGNKSEGETKSE